MSEVLGKISFSDVPDVNGVNVLLNAGNTPSILADILANRPAAGTVGRLFIDTTNNTMSRDTGSSWINIGGSASLPLNSVQFNNSGSFGGSSSFTWNTTTNSLQINNGTNGRQLALGALTDPATAFLYTEVPVVDINIEASRTYFNRGTAAQSSWIINAYNGVTPYIRLIDGDDDPPYIQFDTVGTGSFSLPQFRNQFGAKGGEGTATNGFSWKTNDTEIASLDSGSFIPPRGTTAQRPSSPTAGAIRHNTDASLNEVFQAPAWVQHTGTIAKSVTTSTITATAGGTVFSGTILGGTLGTNKIVRIKAAGTMTLSNRSWNPTFIYGGTTMWSDTAASVSGTAGWCIELILAPNNGSATAQNLMGTLHVGGVGATNTGNTGDASTDEILSVAIIHGTAAVNSALNQTFSFTTGTFSGTITNFQMYYYTMELL